MLENVHNEKGYAACKVAGVVFVNPAVEITVSERFPMPSAQVWRAVAEILTQGFSFLHPTARVAIGIGALLGIVCEILTKKTKGKFPISGVGFGLAFALNFADCLAMGLGSIIVWLLARSLKSKKSTSYKIFVENSETLCAGGIAGGALIGIILILIETFFAL
jgi:uncharacterized oligopeptide transporter (OPT) family protein